MTSQQPNHAPEWAVADAKARFSEMIDRVLSQGPQVITRKGKKTVVVVAAAEWERRTKRRGNLADFFAASPLRGARLEVERLQDEPRDISL
ncbi:MAG TPA: type II toxin-antitoxin system Phd/YefM family antitoxin [Candidatus Dormibacteraeota bacterium]